MTLTLSPTPVITVDGPAASGKTTLARRLAARFGFDHLNTGLLYRAVAFRLFANGYYETNIAEATAIATGLTTADLDNPQLTSHETGTNAGKIATIMPMREALLAYQRDFCANPPTGRGAVLDGRDIGTFIWPQARAKLFVTASAGERARRRLAEIQQQTRKKPLQGRLQVSAEPVTHASVLADLAARDARDAANTPYTLKIASGAYLLDTTLLDVEASLIAAATFAASRF